MKEGHQYALQAGRNSFGFMKCPFCKAEGEQLKHTDGTVAAEIYFTFADLPSAQEYQISGLCQTCQDNTHNAS